MSAKNLNFLSLGLGYVAQALVPALQIRGFNCTATYRNAKAKRICADLAVKAVPFNGKPSKELTTILAKTTHILCSVPPGPSGDIFIAAYRSLLSSLAPNLQWVGYLSATSVYGDRGGQWVFEDEILRPSLARGKARIEAELDWLETGWPVHVFRLAGIYGPGRNALERIKAGKASVVVKAGHISNRVHRDDIVTALLASIKRPHPMRVYNLADDTPASPHQVVNYAARLRGVKLEQTPYAAAKMSEMARSFYKESRKTANKRAKEELGWTLKYPSYKQGLQALLKPGED